MALVALPNLYTLPADVYDYLGTEGTQLRLDDHQQATAQKIIVTNDAALAATTLNITALQHPLIKGSTLEFDGGGTATVVEAILTATAQVGDTTLTVATLASAINAQASAYDNGVNTALAARLVKGCSYGTSQVKLYCCGRYDDDKLATCWTANRWATVMAARWVCKRLLRACPQSIQDDWEECKEEMQALQSGQLHLEDIGMRTSGWPFVTNATVDIGYDYAKIRVEPQLSEGTPTQYGQFVDWNSALFVEF
jgi:hypothetical protein